MILATLLAGCETTVNHLLALDPEVIADLGPLNGQALKLVITDIDLTVYIRVRSHKVALAQHYEGYVDATITGSSVALLKGYFHGFKVGSGVNTYGDLDFIEAMMQLSHKYHLDPEEILAQAVGDITAHKIHSTVKTVGRWASDSIRSLRQDASEYIHEEARLSPSREELNDFYSDIATLRDDVARASARVVRLQDWLAKNGGLT